MTKAHRKQFYSATDLCNFVACPTLTQLDRLELTQDMKRAEKDAQSELITKKGNEHEQRYLKSLKDSGKSVCEIDSNAPFKEKVERTAEALREGHDYIYQAALSRDKLGGYADFLMRVDTPSKLGNFSYEVIDSKLGKNEKASHIIQLCFYSDLLASLQDNHTDAPLRRGRPALIHVYLGSNQLVSYPLGRFFNYYTRRRDEFLRAAEIPPAEGVVPEPCRHCSICHWRDHCGEQWEKAEHLSLVANISRSQRKKLVTAGVTSLRGLAAEKLPPVPGLSEPILHRLHQQAQLQVRSRDNNNAPFYELLPPDDKVPGFRDLPPPQAGDLFYDIEGDPLDKQESLASDSAPLKDGLEYLHGFAWQAPSGEIGYKSFWAKSKPEEQGCFEALMSFIIEHTRRYPKARIYHYSQYEVSALKRLSSQYAKYSKELDDFLRSQLFVDLYRIVKQSVRVSEPRYSIKNLERFYMAKRNTEVKDGGASVVWFEEFKISGDETKLKAIEDYNRDDCESTVKLRDWLLKLKQESARQFDYDWDRPLAQIPPKEAKKETKEDGDKHSKKLTAAEQDTAITRFRTLFGINQIQEKREQKIELTENDVFRETLYHLADFYRREAKPMWWRYYDRQKKRDLLFDDPDCLAQCSLNTSRKPVPVKKSLEYFFTFPPQETKLRVGDSLYDFDSDTKGYAQILSIDTKRSELSLKIGQTRNVQSTHDFSLSPSDHSGDLQNALWQFLDVFTDPALADITSAPRNYAHASLVDILRKQPPRFVDGIRREPIIEGSAQDGTFRSRVVDAALSLDQSYLFIQGPPGTGKTFIGARLAVSLLKAGKRIGVTSNSHKAIHNFLREVDKVALDERVPLHGAKKSDKADEEKHYNPASNFNNELQIIDYFDNKKIDLSSMNLIGGTAWNFANESHRGQFDYLIVDEASQLSLAHLVAAGMCAQNLILIGDPQQLPQPLQGVHPGEIALSPLEYLLGDRATVPSHQGIFLDVCYRMHTDICAVLSEHVYDGRLKAPRENGKQRISGTPKRLIEPETGIVFLPCEHDGNTSSSDEEVALIGDIYKELLVGSFHDKAGKVHPLSPEEIMVIAPYNLQVGKLKDALGDTAQVGTIDLFQGREASVVIVSMTTSNLEDTPRGIDFLFSQQRINVALSRAKALAIIVGSPRLFETRCNTTEQMALVNFFCALAEKNAS